MNVLLNKNIHTDKGKMLYDKNVFRSGHATKSERQKPVDVVLSNDVIISNHIAT